MKSTNCSVSLSVHDWSILIKEVKSGHIKNKLKSQVINHINVVVEKEKNEFCEKLFSQDEEEDTKDILPEIEMPLEIDIIPEPMILDSEEFLLTGTDLKMVAGTCVLFLTFIASLLA